MIMSRQFEFTEYQLITKKHVRSENWSGNPQNNTLLSNEITSPKSVRIWTHKLQDVLILNYFYPNNNFLQIFFMVNFIFSPYSYLLNTPLKMKQMYYKRVKVHKGLKIYGCEKRGGKHVDIVHIADNRLKFSSRSSLTLKNHQILRVLMLLGCFYFFFFFVSNFYL